MKGIEGLFCCLVIIVHLVVFSQIAQIEGKVATPNVIDASKVIAVNDGFDFANYDQAIELMNGKYQTLFQ